MPAPVVTKGDPEEDIKIQFNGPRWLKVRAAEAARLEGMSYSEFLKAAIRDRIEAVEAKHKRRR